MTITRTRRRIRAGFGALVTSTALVAALLALAPVPAAQGRSSTTTAEPAAIALAKGPSHVPAGRGKPTVVLVHGAFADASSWGATIERLRKLGYPVIAPANPLRGVAADSAYLASVLATLSGPLVLVAHSYGGEVITEAASGQDNVKALVYVDGFMPDVGEAGFPLSAKFPGSVVGDSIWTVALPDGGQDAYIQADKFHAAFAADVPADLAALMAATQRPLTLAAGSEPATAAAWKTIPTWSIWGSTRWN